MLRVCKSCKEEKAIDQFTKNTKCKYGFTHKCLNCSAAYNLSYYYDNKDKWAETQKKSVTKRRGEGKDVNLPSREYNRRNPEYKRFYAAQRKVHVKQATPAWLSPEQKAHIRRIYKLAQVMKSATGLDYHVDHIIPLRGQNVCGLHVPDNLQVLRSDLNLSKSNTYK